MDYLKRAAVIPFIVLLVGGLTVWYAFSSIQPPSPAGEEAPATAFSAERAFKHVEAIARKPHPVGTAEHDSVRIYLLNQLEQLGLSPEIQEGLYTAKRGRTGLAADLKNILVKIPGSDPTNTILLMSHYDSVPTGKGGADDASGVAAILETIRAVKAGTLLANNTWILFTDGEELGLYGAELFFEEYSGAENIDLVINLEARGTGGPSIMFETNSGNSAIIPPFAKATTYPVANSLTYTIYKLLPNDTDMSVSKRAGIQGLNFAIIQDYLDYHTMQDAPEHLSLSSLQHQGENMISNLRYFGNRKFDLRSDDELVYFNSPGGISYYPASWSLPMSIITLLLFISFLVYLARTGRIALGKYLLSILFYLAILLLASLITLFGWQLIRVIHPEYRWLVQGETYNHVWYLWGFTFLVVSIFITAYTWIRKKWPVHTILSGIYTVWTLASLAAAWYLPTASYLIGLPVLFGLTGWVAASDLDKKKKTNRKTTAILLLSVIPALYIVTPTIRLIQVTMTTSLLAASMILLLFIAGLCWPLFHFLVRRRGYLFSVILSMFFLICMIGAAFNAGFDEKHRKQNSINYAMNFDHNTSYWLSRDPSTDSWTRQFLGANPENGRIPHYRILRSNYLKNDAPLLDVLSPEAEIESKSLGDSLVSYTVNMKLPVGGQILSIEYPDIRQLNINGRTAFDGNEFPNSEENIVNRLIYWGEIENSLQLEMMAKPDTAGSGFEMEWINHALPVHLIESYTPREEHMMPVPNSINNASIFRKTFDLDP